MGLVSVCGPDFLFVVWLAVGVVVGLAALPFASRFSLGVAV